jgi:DNA-binding NarL/FixJ family response regulator
VPEKIAERRAAHLIEAQHLFVPTLVEVFAEAGISVEYAGPSLDPRKLLDDEPDLVFLDADFIDEPLEGVRLAHVLLPKAHICVYASSANEVRARAFAAAGADVVLEKTAERHAIVDRLRAVLQRTG